VFSTRQRTGYLFLALILGHVILISAQVNTSSGTRVLEAVTFGLFSEIQRTVTTMVGGVRQVWDGYVGLRGVRAENDGLLQQVEGLQVQLQAEHALARQTHSLLALLDLRRDAGLPTLSARVIAADATPWFRTLTIDRGSEDGVRGDLAVIAPAGVVGRVVGRPGARAAKVQLLIDRNAAAGATIERTGAGGVVMGSDDVSSLRLEYVSNLEDVQAGDVVVTSGIDGIYPKGFVIGHVARVELGRGLYKTIHVQPVVDFTGLEHVLVVVAEPSPSPTPTGAE
jgi:rod shape-determining protein MreC